MLLLAPFIGCSGNQESVESTVDKAAVIRAIPPPEPVANVRTQGATQAIMVTPEWSSISTLYRGFFSDPEALTDLGVELGGCISQGVSLLVAYDTPKRQGRMTLSVPSRALSCMPRITEQALDLSPLTSVTRALSGYRDKLSDKYDIRIASFQTSVLLLGTGGTCQFVPMGDHPPSGNVFGPCIGAGGTHCGPTVAHDTQVSWGDSTMRQLAEGCLR